MASWQKLLQHARNNPKGVRVRDACKLAEEFGFTHRAGGKHPNIYKRKGCPIWLNFQEGEKGMAKPYQVRQLLEAIDALGGVPPDDGNREEPP